MSNRIVQYIFPFAVIMAGVFASASVHAQEKSKRQIRLEETLVLWLGRTADELYLAFGPPITVTELPSGGKLYSFAGKDEIGGSGSGGGDGEKSMNKVLFGKKAGKILDSLDDGQPVVNECVVNFAVDGDGVVTAARVQKNDKTLFIDACSKVVHAP